MLHQIESINKVIDTIKTKQNKNHEYSVTETKV